MDEVNVNVEKYVKNKIFKKQRKLVFAVILLLLGTVAFVFQYRTYRRVVNNPVSIEEVSKLNGDLLFRKWIV